jgi:hypothetical protein
VAVDSNGSYQTGSNAASVTFAHTCSGSDRLIEVKVAVVAFTGSTISCSGVTYDGVALSSAGSKSYVNGSFTYVLYIFYGAAPTTAGANVVASFTKTGTFTSYAVKAVSWTGVDQASPLTDFDSASASGSNTTTSLTLTTGVDGAVSDYVHAYSAGDALTPDSGNTTLGESANTPAGYNFNIGASYKAATTASTATTWAIGSTTFNHIAAAWAPVAAPVVSSGDTSVEYPTRWYSSTSKSSSGWYR